MTQHQAFQQQQQALQAQGQALNQVLQQLTTVVDALRQEGLAPQPRERAPPAWPHWLMATAAVSALCSVVTISAMRWGGGSR